MTINTSDKTDILLIQRHLKTFDFKALFFEELGCDILREASLFVTIGNETYTLCSLVEKHHVKTYVCDPNQQGNIPDDANLRKVKCDVMKYTYEHILIFIDAAHENHIWQWVKYATGKSLTARYERLHKHQSGERLAQKLQHLDFSISEEE